MFLNMYRFLIFCAAGLLTFGQPALATIGCEIVATEKGGVSAPLYAEPDETSQIIRDVPAGDIVFYPDQDLAPVQAENWTWVQHDETQDILWNSGAVGWMKSENVSDFCG